jgi:hypothetical protein
MPIPAPVFHPGDRALVAKKRPPAELQYVLRDPNWKLLKTETHRTPLESGDYVTTRDGARRRIVGFALTDEIGKWDALTVPDPPKPK